MENIGMNINLFEKGTLEYEFCEKLWDMSDELEHYEGKTAMQKLVIRKYVKQMEELFNKEEK